jgi:hypothetical protein
MDSWGVYSQLKAPVEQVEAFVVYHLRMGAEQLFLFFDDPEDPAIAHVENKERVTVIRCDQAYWAGVPEVEKAQVIQRQAFNSVAALRLAHERALQWLVFIDVDELLYASRPISSMFAEVPHHIDTVVFVPLEAVPESIDPSCPFSSGWFRSVPCSVRRRRIVLMVAVLLGCKRSFVGQRYFRGHNQGKSAVRLSANPLCMRAHRPRFSGRWCQAHSFDDARVLHFESNGFLAWKSKMERWLATDWMEQGRGRRLQDQLLPFSRIQQQPLDQQDASLRELYKSIYFIDPWRRVLLRALRLLKRVDLDPTLFESPREES